MKKPRTNVQPTYRSAACTLIFKPCRELQVQERSNLKLGKVRSLIIMLLLSVMVLPVLSYAAGATELEQTVEITLGATADGYADSMYPKQSYGNRQILYVGNSIDRAQNLSGPARIYIEFDLSVVPRHARVVSAEMSLYQMYAPASSQTLDTHMVTSAWNESTIGWRIQPSIDPAVLSTAEAPPTKDVWLSWNVTSAAQAWLNGESPNYGLTIRIHTERTGTPDEASGFFSREYLKGELGPKLQVLCTSQPPFTYIFPVNANGLPSNLTSTITADNGAATKVLGGEVGYFLFASGTTHRLTANEYVVASDSVRYHASANSTMATSGGEFTVTYGPQFRVTMKSEPPGLIEPESSNWYDASARITTPTAQDAFDEGPAKRAVFDGWYINDVKQTGNPIEYVVAAPANLTARYTLMYNVNASSPVGQVSGSGWHAAGSSVEITVEPTYLPDEGFLGYLGFGTSFDYWTGTVESTSSILKVTVDGPIEERAVWREDRSRLLAGVAVVIGLLVVLMLLSTRGRRSRSREPTSRRATKKLAPERRRE
jgi:hypothetical protein